MWTRHASRPATAGTGAGTVTHVSLADSMPLSGGTLQGFAWSLAHKPAPSYHRRNPKSEIRRKSENRCPKDPNLPARRLGHWGFVLGISFGFRESDFGFMGPDDVRHRPPDRRLDHLLLLAQVDLARAGRRAGAGVAADVLRRVAQRPQPRLRERPPAHVLRLL